ncbi:hypothetical protein DICPUDRAFT_79686 [Dictyostelium purpureum]|uniref:Uncharacterized protein n=1 Tax=Dictyostelium purpureum TaxID=5786 RepID=F0ZNB4_DICPU|nr:uncharacterized protein DICPUDRAFT_79686 [Dictyostelium purpureum]EGC34584.1 hypothetical protein DICPUDRAFT_79686 [Dictyostelium purpureum]|eukprot:XP_003288908.1 hypothetical protein DICPUDRAFT_79686 [Dictyostelium purpureum]
MILVLGLLLSILSIWAMLWLYLKYVMPPINSSPRPRTGNHVSRYLKAPHEIYVDIGQQTYFVTPRPFIRSSPPYQRPKPVKSPYFDPPLHLSPYINSKLIDITYPYSNTPPQYAPLYPQYTHTYNNPSVHQSPYYQPQQNFQNGYYSTF